MEVRELFEGDRLQLRICDELYQIRLLLQTTLQDQEAKNQAELERQAAGVLTQVELNAMVNGRAQLFTGMVLRNLDLAWASLPRAVFARADLSGMEMEVPTCTMCTKTVANTSYLCMLDRITARRFSPVSCGRVPTWLARSSKTPK